MKFANFVYFCTTRGKGLPHCNIVVSDFANFTGLYFPHFKYFATKRHDFMKFRMLFPAVLMYFLKSKVCRIGGRSIPFPTSIEAYIFSTQVQLIKVIQYTQHVSQFTYTTATAPAYAKPIPRMAIVALPRLAKVRYARIAMVVPIISAKIALPTSTGGIEGVVFFLVTPYERKRVRLGSGRTGSPFEPRAKIYERINLPVPYFG